MSKPYITIYTKENGKQELTERDWFLQDGMIRNTRTLHRKDGPAVEYNKAREWWLDGQRHRADGPAIERSNNSGNEWYIKGKPLTREHEKYMEALVELKKLVKQGLNKEAIVSLLLTSDKKNVRELGEDLGEM